MNGGGMRAKVFGFVCPSPQPSPRSREEHERGEGVLLQIVARSRSE